MGVSVIGLGTPRSAGENFGYTWERLGQSWEHLGAPATSLGAPTTSLEVPETSLGVPWTSLGATRITVEQSGKNYIFFGSTTGVPGNHSYYLSFNGFSNSCIQFVFSYMYLCIYIATHLHMVCLDCGCRRCLRAIRGVREYDDRVNSQMHTEVMIARVLGCTWRPQLSKFGDTLGGRDRPSLEMPLGGRDRASVEMHLEAVIERGWRCTWRL